MAANKDRDANEASFDNPRDSAVNLLLGRTITAVTFNDDTGTVTVYMDDGRLEVQGHSLKLVCIPTDLSKLH